MAMSEEVKEILAKLKKFDIFSTDPKQRQEVNKILEEMSGRVTQSDMDAMREESIRIKSELEARLKRADELEIENAKIKARLERAIELPVSVGDLVYDISGVEVQELKIQYIYTEVFDVGKSWMISCSQKAKEDFVNLADNVYGITWFTTKAEAEARLAKLRGEK